VHPVVRTAGSTLYIFLSKEDPSEDDRKDDTKTSEVKALKVDSLLISKGLVFPVIPCLIAL
jgi:hypothetical protein